MVLLGPTREEAVAEAWKDYAGHEPEWAWYLSALREVSK